MERSKLLIRDAFFSTILSIFTCYLLSLLFFNTSFFDPLSKTLEDFSFLDVYYAERLGPEQNNIDTSIVLVNVEHKTRDELALALQKVLKSRPKVVGFDVILKEFEKTEADTLLAELLNQKSVVTSTILQSDGPPITNHPFFNTGGTSGFTNFNLNSKSSVVRDFNGVHILNDNRQSAFAVALARKYFSEKAWIANKMDSKISKARVINYQGGLDHYLNLTVDELMKLENDDLLANKMVLFGYLGSPTNNAFDIEDKHFTPLNKITAGKSVPDMYGLVIHANILSMLITDNFMYKISKFWRWTLLFLLSFLASVYFIWLGTRLKISYRTVRKAVLFVFSVLFMWVTLLLFQKGIVLKAAPIIAVTVFSAGFVKYYKHIVGYIKTKRKFDSYIK